MKAPQNIQNKIELRSEKVRKLIGEIPRSLVKWSTLTIIVILVMLVCVFIFIPFPFKKLFF